MYAASLQRELTICGGMDFHQVSEAECGNWQLEMTSTLRPVALYQFLYFYHLNYYCKAEPGSTVAWWCSD